MGRIANEFSLMSESTLTINPMSIPEKKQFDGEPFPLISQTNVFLGRWFNRTAIRLSSA